MNIVGITACPTGIAHTFMAQSALEKTGKQLGHQITIETQGAMGIENELKKKAIAEADVVILAVGCLIEKKERFEGKKVLEVGVQAAISHPKKVIEDALKLVNS
ncbi:PTS fructose transporter subunit IIB [Alkalihalobacillus sp. MEB130]|uniref:PTS fructose transporter subunit IIB n=1 Tax=Alkalihalobacillus sp. MEB130 TaxID=2976704 RepID=UPI0028DE485D|nr:PTS fructose transporter subunit IIB [Alkalihalobacillus sp. MEB130]MDT8861806.1 PTS fructose transporter subunit IIB [Alkalihalobacillus sp. MEB130]